jgi:Ca2+-binding RTX toxin-like protein
MAVFTGTIFNDTITTTFVSFGVIRNPFWAFPSAAADWIDAGLGNDVVASGGGNDTIYGGWGNDWIDGGDDNDWINGGLDNDTIYGGWGNDTIYGDWGNDWINAGPGNDWVDAGFGNDTILGGGGTDTVYGGLGNDLIYSSGWGYYDAGWDNDYVYAAAGVPETLLGNSGIDWLNVASWSGNYSVNLSTGVTNYWGESFTGFEHLVTGSGHDTLLGTLGNNYLAGGAGNDRFVGSWGSDTLVGGSGDDDFVYYNGDSTWLSEDYVSGFDFGVDAVTGDKIDVSNLTGSLTFGVNLWTEDAFLSSDTIVKGDANSDGWVDFQVRVADGGTLAAYWQAIDFIV